VLGALGGRGVDMVEVDVAAAEAVVVVLITEGTGVRVVRVVGAAVAVVLSELGAAAVPL